MAGVKVTDLTTLGVADPTDVMYIVDTSSNQSKQIEVQNIYSGLPQFSSGDWSPTPTNTGGTNPIVVIGKGNYSRVGSVVTCSLFFEVEMDAAENIAQFTLDLPIASNFTNAKDAFGIISFTDIGNGEFQSFNISADVAGNQIEIRVGSLSNGVSFQNLVAILQYVIIP